MPFKSKAQRRWMYSQEPEMARRWERHTSDEDLPERVEEVLAHDDLPDPEEIGKEYQKTGTAFAVRMDEPFEVETKEGPVTGKSGDYLVKGIEGEMWPIDADIFDQTYLELSEALTPELEQAIDQDEDEEALEAAYDETADEPEEPAGIEVGEADAMTQMLDAELDFEEEPAEEPAPEPEDGEPEEPIEPVSRAARRPKEYSRRYKSAATRGPELYATEYTELRDDIDEYSQDIDDLHAQGKTYGEIARTLNDVYDLQARPGPRRRKTTPGARRLAKLKCPECKGAVERGEDIWSCIDEECGWEMTRSFTPTQVSDYLKAAGKITRGAASRPQDLGARIPHTHDVEEEPHREDCPACSWQAGGFESEYGAEERDQATIDTLRQLSQDKETFTTWDAIEKVGEMDQWKTDILTPHYPPCVVCGSTRRRKTKTGDIACRECANLTDPSDLENLEVKFYKTRRRSDATLPRGFRNMADYVIWTLKNNPNFEPVIGEKEKAGRKPRPYKDYTWIRKMASDRPFDVEWRYVEELPEIKENHSMSKTCASCEEGNHQRCRDEWCDCCGGATHSLKEIFGEAMNRPPGSQAFQNWNKLGSTGAELKKQADFMKGNVYQTQDGQLMFYKDQMQTGEQPMVADVTQGVWQPMQKQQGYMQPAQGGSPSMGNVFSSRAKE